MKPPSAKVTQMQERLISALLSTSTIDAACHQIGLSSVTAWRWMKQPAFKDAYREARQQVVEHAIVLLQRLCATAVATLEGIMTNAEAPTSSRVMAARTVLEMSLRAVELESFETRLATLEAGRRSDDS